MSSGTQGLYAEVITRKDLFKVCRKQLLDFEKVLNDGGLLFDDFCRSMAFEGAEVEKEVSAPNVTELAKAYDNLLKAFSKKAPGLSLYIVHSEADEAYDEFEGGNWAVEGCYVPSSAKKKLEKKFGVSIDRQHWTVYG